MNENLCDQTIRLLKESGTPRRVIAEKTGLGFGWLNALVLGEIADPGVRKIERLHAYLTEQQSAA